MSILRACLGLLLVLRPKRGTYRMRGAFGRCRVSLPQTFIGMRNGISLCLVIIVVAEMFIGSTDGIGHRLIEAQMLFEVPTRYAAIFAAGALGYGMNWIFLTIEKTFVHWGGK